MFSVSADSKGLKPPVGLFRMNTYEISWKCGVRILKDLAFPQVLYNQHSTLARGRVSADSKGFRMHQNCAKWAVFRKDGLKKVQRLREGKKLGIRYSLNLMIAHPLQKSRSIFQASREKRAV